jgi:8-oxo-dGTP pyrophosphatase MutT (NUDIX family)
MLKALRTALAHTYFRLMRPMTLGVRIIAVDDQNRVCLVRHTYTPGWHLPGGGVERGETCMAAALKEAHEEAGLLIAPSDIKLVSLHANFANFPGDHVAVYRAINWTQTATNTAHEIAEFAFFALDNLPEGTTAGTRRRLGEMAGAATSSVW